MNRRGRHSVLAAALTLAGCRASCASATDVGGTSGLTETSTTASSPAAALASSGPAASNAATAPSSARLPTITDARDTSVLCGESPPVGLLEDPTGDPWGQSCSFRGVVRELREGVYHYERATRVLLDRKAGAVACAVDRLRGGHQTGGDPTFEVAQLIVTLEPGLTLPFGIGDVVCGSVRWFPQDGSIDMDLADEALIAGPEGNVLLAFSRHVARDGSPLRDWKLSLGRQRTFERPRVDEFDYFDMVVEHAGTSAIIEHGSGFASLRAPDGVYRVRARGMRAVGVLSQRWRVRDKIRYDFTIVRAAGE